MSLIVHTFFKANIFFVTQTFFRRAQTFFRSKKGCVSMFCAIRKKVCVPKKSLCNKENVCFLTKKRVYYQWHFQGSVQINLTKTYMFQFHRYPTPNLACTLVVP